MLINSNEHTITTSVSLLLTLTQIISFLDKLTLLIVDVVTCCSVFNLSWTKQCLGLCIQRHVVGYFFINRLQTFYY